MVKKLTYKEEVWASAVLNAEQEVLRHCPISFGGRFENESVEEYAARGWRTVQGYLERLRDARDALKEVQPKTTMTTTKSRARRTKPD